MLEDLKKLNNTKEGRALVSYLESEIKRLDSDPLDPTASNEVIAREYASRDRVKKAYRKLLRLISLEETKEKSLKNREYE